MMKALKHFGSKVFLITIMTVTTIGCCPLRAQQYADQPCQAGKEFRVDDQTAGIDGYFLVYVPTDYDPAEKWPVIFYYHGLGGRPDTSAIRKIVEGKYCVVVGMSYYAAGMEGYKFLETEDVCILKHALSSIKKKLSIDDKRLYVAGFSKGGFYTCEMLRLQNELLAGAIVLGAGSKSLKTAWPSLAAKEIFIGCGQNDNFLETAKKTQKHLAALGATVTFEQWPGIGHSIGDISGLRKWLFEQTVNRPNADPTSPLLANKTDKSEVPAAPRDSFITNEIIGTAIVVGLVLLSVALVTRRKNARPKTFSQDQSKDGNL